MLVRIMMYYRPPLIKRHQPMADGVFLPTSCTRSKYVEVYNNIKPLVHHYYTLLHYYYTLLLEQNA